jgi:hypothetical protein
MLVVFYCRGCNTMRCCRIGGGAEGWLGEICYGREYVERSTHKSKPGTDLAKCPDGEEDANDKARKAIAGGESDKDTASTIEPEPAKWSRDIDEDDGEGTDRGVGRGGGAETGWDGKMVREGRLETEAGWMIGAYGGQTKWTGKPSWNQTWQER